MTLKAYSGTGLLTAGTKVRSKVGYSIKMKEVGGQRLIDAYITAPSHLLHAAWKVGRSKLQLESGESLDVTVLSLRGTDLAPIAIGMASRRSLEAGQRGDAEDAGIFP